METIFCRIDAAHMVIQGREKEKASGGQGNFCYVIAPKKKAEPSMRGAKIVDFSAYRAAHPVKEEVRSEEKPASGKIPFGLIVDLCATVAILAVLVLVLIRF